MMDSYGVDRAVVIGWSAGVNVAFEAAESVNLFEAPVSGIY